MQFQKASCLNFSAFWAADNIILSWRNLSKHIDNVSGPTFQTMHHFMTSRSRETSSII